MNEMPAAFDLDHTFVGIPADIMKKNVAPNGLAYQIWRVLVNVFAEISANQVHFGQLCLKYVKHCIDDIDTVYVCWS